MGNRDNRLRLVQGRTFGVIACDPSGIEGQSHDAGRTGQLVFRAGYRTVTDLIYL